MKYFTKEWARLSNLTDIHTSLEILEHEIEYSELFDRKKEEYLSFEKEISEVKFEGIIDEFDENVLRNYGFSDEEIRNAKDEYDADILKMKENFDALPLFNAEDAKASFDRSIEFNQNYLSSILPNHVKEELEDIKLISLDYATPHDYQILENFCIQNQEIVDKAIKEFDTERQSYKSFYQENNLENFGYHDAYVKEIIFENKDLIIDMDNSFGFTEVNKVRFVECEVVKMDEDLIDSYWLYEELYPHEKGIEVHILFAKDEDFKELILIAKKIISYK